jgi:hypothetical protein
MRLPQLMMTLIDRFESGENRALDRSQAYAGFVFLRNRCRNTDNKEYLKGHTTQN